MFFRQRWILNLLWVCVFAGHMACSSQGESGSDADGVDDSGGDVAAHQDTSGADFIRPADSSDGDLTGGEGGEDSVEVGACQEGVDPGNVTIHTHRNMPSTIVILSLF